MLYLFAVIVLFSFYLKDKLSIAASLLVTMSFYYFTPPFNKIVQQQCSSPLSIVQYNLAFNNDNLEQFVESIAEKQPDLVVLNEASPEHAEQFSPLFALYPHRFGGQENIGYPSNVFILSKALLYGLQIERASYGGNLIQGVWQPKEGIDVSVFFAHPPSPRSQSLWRDRNSMINLVEYQVSKAVTERSLVAGDFNLSSMSPRYKQTLKDHQSIPVRSWSMVNQRLEDYFGIRLPLLGIAIDHLWLKGEQKAQAILCSRRSLIEIKGSDHYPVLSFIQL
ncbi:endonuclease/exonuclease/phosphatase family protein [Vibrio maerlii]|uniref:endonuclease/exonuclease/phosphatase family protein n=1 Tax=Vibrio maerlii TaxID=2231648 RepID=UPI0013DF96F4|nr:endonuclease/exonuclease/phosphatase family protein [Vibrio maerlii]